MKDMRKLTVLSICVLTVLLSACSYKAFEDSLRKKSNKEEGEEYSNPASIPNESKEDKPEDEEQGLYFVGDTITFTFLDETFQYTLHQVQVSDNIGDVDPNIDDFKDKSLISDNGDIDEDYRLVTVDVTVKNIDYEGYEDEDDPILEIEMCVGFKEGIEDPDGPWNIYASYFSEHPPLDVNHGQDYYFFPLPIGDEIDAAVGWFLPADQLKEEPLYYIIGCGGSSEYYQYFELNFD